MEFIHNELIGANGFFRTIRALYNLEQFGQNIEIRVLINAINFKRLPSLAEFIYRNLPFVWHVAFMGLEIEGRAKANIDKMWIDPVDYMQELRDAIFILRRRLMNVSIYNHQLCLMPNDLWKFARKSISEWKNTYLDVCKECLAYNKCGGFFRSSEKRHSAYIKPVV